MTGIYDRLRAVAIRLLDEYGHDATLVQTTTTDGENEWDPPVITTTESTVRIFATGVDKQLVDGTSIIASDLQVITYSNDIRIEDVLEIRGKSYQVRQEVPVPASGDVTVRKYIVR